jgi:perosamine synthetase
MIYSKQASPFHNRRQDSCRLLVISFFHTHISPRSIELVTQTLRTACVSEGKLVREFEQELSRTLGMVRPVAVNSGTSALHLGLVLAGVGPGDEVILPAQTFVASGLVILMCRAKPVFADIGALTGNLNPTSLRSKITARTKAIMPVHWAGSPCDMDEISAIAREHNLAVIEDAAHALGATYKGRPVGSLSRFTAFSFQAIKHLTTGDGGALCCADEQDFEEAKRGRWFGIDRARHLPSILGEREYNLKELGYKYHLNDLAAAVGLGNLPDMPRNLARRRSIASRYRQGLQNLSGLTHLEYRADRESAWWLFTALVERREDFIQALKSRDVPASVVHLGIDRNSIFGGPSEKLAQQRQFDERQVALPIHAGLTDEDVETVIGAVKAGW